jgi:hypothetical protein
MIYSRHAAILRNAEIVSKAAIFSPACKKLNKKVTNK